MSDDFIPYSVHHLQAGVEMPELVPYLGKTVKHAWINRTPLFVVVFNDNSLVFVELLSVDDGLLALNFHGGICGDETIGDCDRLLISIPDLHGRKFTGMDHSVITFDNDFGVELTSSGVQWMRRPKG